MDAGLCYYPKSDGAIYDNFCTGLNPEMGAPAQPLTQPHIYNVLSRTNEWTCRINGVTHYSTAGVTPDFTFRTPELGNDGSYSFSGYIAEVLIYGRALSAPERLAVGSYLSQRYGLFAPAPTPTNLAALAVSPSQISVSWSNSLSTTGLVCTVQRRAAGASYATVATLENALSFFDTGLIGGTEYFYRVKAATYGGESDYSAEISAATLTSGSDIPLNALKLWLKADCGHGGSPVNSWLDQTTNDNSAYFRYGDVPNQPVWVDTQMNGHPAIYFQGSNGFSLPILTVGWAQGEAFVVVESLGAFGGDLPGLWLMSQSANPSRYPDVDASIFENFGVQNLVIRPGPQDVSLSSPHLYNVMSSQAYWFSRFNNQDQFSRNGTIVSFNSTQIPRLGWGSSTLDYFRGYVSEVLMFNRQLSESERTAVAESYLRKRFSLW
jgi:hypothetical protein